MRRSEPAPGPAIGLDGARPGALPYRPDMQDSLFADSSESPRLQPLVFNQTVEAFFTQTFGCSAEDAVEDALWAGQVQGPLSQRLNLREALIRKLHWELRNNDDFRVEMTRGFDRRGNLRRELQRWIRRGV